MSRRLDYVRIPLTIRKAGEVQVASTSGLNWGQRPGRNENQAYLPIPVEYQRSGFFPGIGVPFRVLCDDGQQLTLVQAQQNGKALHTPEDNSILGKYFRDRLGVPHGMPVGIHHLERYGRFALDISIDDSGNYLLDFSKEESNSP